jgi:hypothetical protein
VNDTLFGNKMNKIKYKNARLSEQTHQQLGAHGNALESMEDVIIRLLAFWDANHKEGAQT